MEWPVGESVTIWKLHALHRTIGIHTGTIADGHALYENLDEIMCRTKLVVKTQADEVQKHYSPDEYGIHRAATLGDLRPDVKGFAVLAGFGVIEEDKPSSPAIAVAGSSKIASSLKP